MRDFRTTLAAIVLNIIFLSPIIYGLYWLDILYYVGLACVGVAVLTLFVFILWYLDCRGKSGCISGVVLVPVVIFLPLGLLLLVVDYFIHQ